MSREAVLPVPTEARRIVEDSRGAVHPRTPQERQTLQDAVVTAIRSRDRRELADLDLRRSIIRLDDEGVSQRRIAEIVGLSQPEISRRLKRRETTPMQATPRELVLRRAAGLMSTAAMMRELKSMTHTSVRPSGASVDDTAAGDTGSAPQLARAYQDGLLTRAEYDDLRRTIRVVTRPRAT
jgi:predicted transcriptional regulator